MLTKETVIDKIEITEEGSVQVRRAIYIVENGVRIAGPMYHRSAYVPGDEKMADEHAKVRVIAQAAWTPDVVEAARQRRDAQTPR